jgi:hypothetical protein
MAESLLEPKDREKRVKEDKDYTSSKIGDLSRLIAYGIIAVAFTLLTSTAPFSVALVKAFPYELRGVAILGIASAVLDYAQYLVGYIDSSAALKRENYRYSKSSPWYRLRIAFYWAKQASALVGATLLACTILRAAP